MNILVVDDDRDIADIIGYSLRKEATGQSWRIVVKKPWRSPNGRCPTWSCSTSCCLG